MVVSGVTLAATQSLLLPTRSSVVSSLIPHSSSRLRHFSTDCQHLSRNSDGSLWYLISYPSHNGFPIPYSRRLLKPVSAADSIHPPAEITNKDEVFKQWDWWTAKFAAVANVPLFLLQLPQILLNARNLTSGNNSALLAISWLGMLSSLLGGLSLVSYFAKKGETEGMIVQCIGVTTVYVVISQLAIAQAMPFPLYIAASVVVGVGVISNFLNYVGMLPPSVWHIWEDFITVGGLSLLPQVMWSTFVPYVPNSVLPGGIAFVAALVAVAMARTGKLSQKSVKIVGALSAWTATLLFMWMPIAQMWTNFLNPENIKGLSALTMLLAVVGNGLLIPRSLFVRDFMWCMGSSWATFMYGWGNLVSMFLFNSVSREFFWGVTAGISIWTGLAFWKDSRAYGHGSPFRSLKELVLGPKS